MKTKFLHAVFAGCMLLPSVAFGQEQPPTQPAPTTTATPPSQPAPPPPANGSATPPSQPAAPPSQPAPPPPMESKVKPLPPAPPVEKKITTPIIVAGALGGAAILNGVVFGIMALGEKSSYDDAPNHKVGVAGERASFIADLSFAVGGLFALTAVAMYFLPDEPQPQQPSGAPPPDAPKASKASITPKQVLKSALTGEVLRF